MSDTPEFRSLPPEIKKMTAVPLAVALTQSFFGVAVFTGKTWQLQSTHLFADESEAVKAATFMGPRMRFRVFRLQLPLNQAELDKFSQT